MSKQTQAQKGITLRGCNLTLGAMLKKAKVKPASFFNTRQQSRAIDVTKVTASAAIWAIKTADNKTEIMGANF